MSHGHNLIRSSTIVSEAVLTPPTLPGFYPHSDGPLRARCRLGSDLKPRSITTMMDLGCWDAAIYPAISKGSAGFSQSSEQGGGCHCQSTLEKQIVSKTNKTDLCFPSTQQPIRLSFLDFRSPGAHRLRRSTRADAVRWQVFRATATDARFLAFFPPRWQSFIPNRRKSVSGPNGPRM